MKKLVALLLAALMLFSVTSALAAEMIPGYYVPPAMNEGQYPIAEEGVTLTYWLQLDGTSTKYMTDFQGNPAYRKVQEDTGITLEFIHPAAGSAKESFNLMLNSGKLPDMFQVSNENWYTGGTQAMYDDGIIIDITPYLDEYAPQYKEVSEYNDLGYAQMHKDGKVLAFYKVTYGDKTPYIFFDTHKDWMEEYPAGEPVTLDEYEAYFDWILENKEGVIPVWFSMSAEMQMDLTMGAYDFLYNWYLVDGSRTVNYWACADGYKDWLTRMNDWYNKGYFSRDFASLTSDEVNALWDAGKLAVSADGGAFNTRAFTPINLNFPRLAADSVIGYAQASNPVGDGGDYPAMITTACDNVEAAVQFFNYGYTFEGSLPYNFGIEGEAWNWDENNMPKFTELCTNNPDGLTNIDVCWVLHVHFATRYTYPDDLTIPAAGTEDIDDYQAWRTRFAGDENFQNFLQMPPITLTAEESAERTDIMVQVDTFAKEKMFQFITGAESLDNFDSYLAELKDLGIDRAKEITQEATDRFYANAR